MNRRGAGRKPAPVERVVPRAVWCLPGAAALGLMPPVQEQAALEVTGRLVQHALVGVAVVAAYNLLPHWAE